MKQTVVGVFDRYAAAQHAADLLQDRGIDPDCIHVTGADDSAPDREEGGVLSSMKHFFADLFGEEDHQDVSSYSEAVRHGGAIVKVDLDAEPEVEMARETLQTAGAVDIDERMQEWQQSESTAAADTSATSAATTGTLKERDTASGEEVIPVLREEIEVGKRTVQAGGVRVYARTVEEPVSESLNLREERAVVDRRPVDRPATAADFDALKDRSIEVTESVERPVVQKTARVVEEVVVGKEVRNRQTTIEDKVRHTEVDVQQLQGDLQAGTDAYYRSDFDARYAAQGGRYEDYAPAYRFGETLRSDPRYAGRAWDDVEADAQRDWATRYPDSPWERFKAAVRHAWDRITD